MQSAVSQFVQYIYVDQIPKEFISNEIQIQVAKDNLSEKPKIVTYFQRFENFLKVITAK